MLAEVLGSSSLWAAQPLPAERPDSLNLSSYALELEEFLHNFDSSVEIQKRDHQECLIFPVDLTTVFAVMVFD